MNDDRAERLRCALAKCLANTSVPPTPSPELLRWLLASVERISKAALVEDRVLRGETNDTERAARLLDEAYAKAVNPARNLRE